MSPSPSFHLSSHAAITENRYGGHGFVVVSTIGPSNLMLTLNVYKAAASVRDGEFGVIWAVHPASSVRKRDCNARDTGLNCDGLMVLL